MFVFKRVLVLVLVLVLQLRIVCVCVHQELRRHIAHSCIGLVVVVVLLLLLLLVLQLPPIDRPRREKEGLTTT